MPDPKLLDYLRSQLALGKTQEETKKSLISIGWKAPELDEAFTSLTPSFGPSGPSGSPAPLSPSPAPAQNLTQTPASNSPPIYAGFWVRFAAFIIDITLLGLPFGTILVLTKTRFDLSLVGILITLGILSTIYSTLWIWLVAQFGATPGKMLFGMRIEKDGHSLGWTSATVREMVGKTISTLIFFFGFILAGVSPRKQALHDKMAGTDVVFKNPLGFGRKALVVATIVTFFVASNVLGLTGVKFLNDNKVDIVDGVASLAR